MVRFDEMLSTISWWPIMEGIIVYMILGMLWYSPLLFADQWLRENKISRRDAEEISMVYSLLGSALIGFVMSLGLALALRVCNVVGVVSGMMVAFLIALLFAVPPAYSATLWERKSLQAFMIETGRVVLFLVITGGLLGWYT